MYAGSRIVEAVVDKDINTEVLRGRLRGSNCRPTVGASQSRRTGCIGDRQVGKTVRPMRAVRVQHNVMERGQEALGTL